MGSSIIETVVRSNGMAPRPQALHGTEHHQPLAAPSPTSGTFQPVKYNSIHPVKPAARGTISCGDQALFPQHASQALLPVDAVHGSTDVDAALSLPPVNGISQAPSGHIAGTGSDTSMRIVSSDSAESTLPTTSGASASTERPPPVADVQPDDDLPIYSIGRIKVFNKLQRAIEPAFEARWETIYPKVFDRVLLKLQQRRFGMRPKRPRALPNIQLMSAGPTKDTSIPAVVVAIPKRIETMQAFLNKDSIVQNLCKPRDGTTVELQVFACEDQSTLIGMPGEPIQTDETSLSDSDSDDLSDDEDSAFSRDDNDNGSRAHYVNRDFELDPRFLSVFLNDRAQFGGINRGLDIRLATTDGSRYIRGTCGGLLQLQTPNHPPQQVGLLAGHLIEQLKQTSNITSQVDEDYSIIGDILYPRNPGEIPRHDWALFDADKLGFKYAMANRPNLSIAQESELPKENTVVLIRTSRGEVRGTLSSSTSGIVLNLDQGFVQVRMIIMDKGSAITKGDSGAWVVHEGLHKIYGHIVATNSNGDAYMMPLHATITEMKTTLGAVDISLATSPDLGSQNRPATAHWRLEQTEGSMPQLETHEQIFSLVNLNGVRRGNDIEETHSKTREAEKATFDNMEMDHLASQHELVRESSADGQASEAVKSTGHVVAAKSSTLAEANPKLLESQAVPAVAGLTTSRASDPVKLQEHVAAVSEATCAEHDELTSEVGTTLSPQMLQRSTPPSEGPRPGIHSPKTAPYDSSAPVLSSSRPPLYGGSCYCRAIPEEFLSPLNERNSSDIDALIELYSIYRDDLCVFHLNSYAQIITSVFEATLSAARRPTVESVPRKTGSGTKWTAVPSRRPAKSATETEVIEFDSQSDNRLRKRAFARPSTTEMEVVELDLPSNNRLRKGAWVGPSITETEVIGLDLQSNNRLRKRAWLRPSITEREVIELDLSPNKRQRKSDWAGSSTTETEGIEIDLPSTRRQNSVWT